MPHALEIEINELPEDTAKVILLAATNWDCTPAEAALRILNEEAARRLKPAA